MILQFQFELSEGEVHMKLGVSSYSFHRLVRSGQMSLLDVISKAKEMGFDVIEFSTFILPEGRPLFPLRRK